MSRMPQWKFEIWTAAQAGDRKVVREEIQWFGRDGKVKGFVRPDGVRTKDFDEAFKAWKEMHR